ncbi:MAG: GNAT family N-acetyltransferase [Clostridiales bacterium]|nr:GNAT family N-acetyltransferase [Clostridiales bacterium]
MTIKEVTDPVEKQSVVRLVLEALPDWFGIPESREAYIRESKNQLLYAAYDEGRPVGFICLKETGKDTAELSVLGVLKEYHRQGIGRDLFLKAKEAAVGKGYSFLQVKTVKMGVYEDYDNTNRFYLALGFKEFEVFPLLWDENNPCQIYVMSLM